MSVKGFTFLLVLADRVWARWGLLDLEGNCRLDLGDSTFSSVMLPVHEFIHYV